MKFRLTIVRCTFLLIALCTLSLCGCTPQTSSPGKSGGITIVHPDFNTARAEFSMVFHLSDTQYATSVGTTFTSMFKGAFTVKPIDGGYTLTLPELQISISSGDASLEFHAGNTYTGEAAIRMLPFKALTEHVFMAIPDETGHLAQLQGFEQVLSSIQSQTEQYGETVTKQAVNTLTEFLNENTLCYIIEKLLFSIPEGTVPQGDQRSRSFQGLAPYSYSIQDTVTYTGRSGKADVFAIDGKVSSGTDQMADALLAEGLPYYEMSGTTAGTCTLFTEGDILRRGSSSGSATGICYFPTKAEEHGSPVSISRQLTYSVRKVD